MSLVKINADLCDNSETFSEGEAVDCFRLKSNPDGEMDLIVASNPKRIGNHIYQMRIAAAVNLRVGIQTQEESGTAGTGLIATHALFMMFGWGVLSPMAIFVSDFRMRSSTLNFHALTILFQSRLCDT
jgi:hypothetical protein